MIDITLVHAIAKREARGDGDTAFTHPLVFAKSRVRPRAARLEIIRKVVVYTFDSETVREIVIPFDNPSAQVGDAGVA